MSNKFLRSISVTAVMFLMSTAGYAGEWSGRLIVSQLTVRADKTVVIRHADGAWRNPDVCSRDNLIVLLPPGIEGGTEAYLEIYATLLAAHLNEREVNVFIDGCAQIGNQTFPVFTELAVY